MASKRNTVSGRQPRAVVIDDQTLTAELYACYLELKGFKVFTCFDGLTGLAAARATYPDLVVANFQMPGLYGTEILVALKAHARTKRIKVIITSGYESVEALARACGADDFIALPTDMDEVLKKVGRLVHS